MLKRIALISPPIQDFFQTINRQEPLGLTYLAAVLEQKDYSVQLIDALPLVVNMACRRAFEGDHVFHKHRLTATAGTDDNRGPALFGSERNVVKNYC